MKPLLAILTHAGADEIFKRNWPTYQNAWCQILTVGSAGQRGLPTPFTHFGPETFTAPEQRIQRFIDVLRLAEPGRWLIIAEYDCVFREPPQLPAHGVAALMRTPTNWHSPWCFDPESARAVRVFAQRMLADGDIERGHLGHFLSALSAKFIVPIYPLNGYCHINIGPEQYPAMRQAIDQGAWVIHGIKTEEALREAMR